MNKEHKLTHIAIVTDGNRRWAVAQGLPKLVGHVEGAKNVKRIAKSAIAHDVSYLTIWGMSTENLKRSEEEVNKLFSLFGQIVDYIDDLKQDNVRLRLIGDLSRLPTETQEKLNHAVESSARHTGMTLTFALIYGGRDEIVRATKKILDAGLHADQITEETFAEHLDTAGMPEVDLVIRTGGHQRLSGYLPWQSVYAELYFTNTFWPAFDEKELDTAIEWFYEQQRNRGK